jgi:excinuclease ABC subunit C
VVNERVDNRINERVIDKIGNAPVDPGVYLMKDETGRIIYVGKARNLRKRLASYVSRTARLDAKTGVLLAKVADVETIVTGTEKEALILESGLIKKHRPRYNVILKDDKRYPSLRIDPGADYPNLRIVRKITKDGGLYFGPFSSPHAVKETLKVIHKAFKIRKCKSDNVKSRERPCLNFQMNACLAPCATTVSKQDYHGIVDEIILFLKGKAPDLINKIKSEMTVAANSKDFEKAAELRDKMFALEKTLEKQVIVASDFMDRDVLGLVSDDFFTSITLLTVRNGFLKGARTFHFTEIMASENELMESFIKQYYEKAQFPPKEILTSVPILSSDILEDVLHAATGKRVHIKYPVRGEKKQLVEMAVQNARTALVDEKTSNAAAEKLLHRLRQRLDLQRFPARIECYDNSNLSGDNAVAAMVVFEYGKPQKSAYRKFNIKTIQKPDDYGTMWEILHRRFAGHGEEKDGDPLPDMVMVDGGKGQLNIAVDVMKTLGLENRFDLIAIAKKDEKKGEFSDKVYKPFRANVVNFGKDRELLLFFLFL